MKIRNPQILGALGAMVRITWANHSKRWLLVSNVGVTQHGLSDQTHRIGFSMFELFRKIEQDFGGSIS